MTVLWSQWPATHAASYKGKFHIHKSPSPWHQLTARDENKHTSETNFCCTYLQIDKIKQILLILGQHTKKKRKIREPTRYTQNLFLFKANKVSSQTTDKLPYHKTPASFKTSQQVSHYIALYDKTAFPHALLSPWLASPVYFYLWNETKGKITILQISQYATKIGLDFYIKLPN